MTGALSTLDLLERLIGFPTVSSASNLPLIGFVAEYLGGLGAAVTRIDSPAIQKDTAKRTATRRGGRTAGHDLAQPGSLRRDGPDCGLRHDLSGADRAMLRAPG